MSRSTFLLLTAPLLLALAACESAPVRPAAERTDHAWALLAGEDAERAGDLRGALVEYARAVAADPRNAEAHYRAARVHVALGNAATARDGLMRALALDPALAAAHESLGLVYLNENRRDAARASLERATQLDSRRWQAWNALGVLADLDTQYRAAREHYGRALDLQPGRAEVFNNVGYSKYLAGDLAGAEAILQQVLKGDPHYAPAWSNIALVYARRGEHERAVQALEQVMPPAQARYTVGYVCLMDRRLDDAETLLRSAIAQSPAYYAEAQQALAYVERERQALR